MHDWDFQFKFHVTHNLESKASKVLLFLQKLTISSKQNSFKNTSAAIFAANFTFSHSKIFKTIRKINKNLIDLIDNDDINSTT